MAQFFFLVLPFCVVRVCLFWSGYAKTLDAPMSRTWSRMRWRTGESTSGGGAILSVRMAKRVGSSRWRSRCRSTKSWWVRSAMCARRNDPSSRIISLVPRRSISYVNFRRRTSVGESDGEDEAKAAPSKIGDLPAVLPVTVHGGLLPPIPTNLARLPILTTVDKREGRRLRYILNGGAAFCFGGRSLLLWVALRWFSLGELSRVCDDGGELTTRAQGS